MKQSVITKALRRIVPNRKPQTAKERLILFRAMRNIIGHVAVNRFPYFISGLKHIGSRKFMHGDVGKFYKMRNSLVFKNFFYERELHEMIKADLEEMYPVHKGIKLALSRNGVMVYDNYKNREFNTLLLTNHAGTWVPKRFEEKMQLTERDRLREEDLDSDKIYSNVVLKKGGIWINSKLSRFVCDYNRSQRGCIYFQEKERWLKKQLWKESFTKSEINRVHSWHSEYYHVLFKVLETYRFNIVYDGHTMKDKPGRPNMSFGTRYIPSFYMPIVKRLRVSLMGMGYSPIFFNKPYKGGFVLKWLSSMYPHKFIFSMEINKRLYTNKSRTRSHKRKLEKIRCDITELFDI
jgi:N-formylglutamate amidohydrolase